MVTKTDNSNTETVMKNLEEEKEAIVKQMAELKADDPFSDPDHANDNAAVDTDSREQQSHDVIEAEVNTLQNRFNDIEIALKKIKKGQYGYCSKCAKTIPAARLALIPEAQYCVDCEQKLRN